ncbi:hypothetical protein [Citrobacter portucalensis]|uniref:hypothetical protein n=1 Tax=Citrobacter portucalensis TaxID=1639133 RepID=UPI003BF5417E
MKLFMIIAGAIIASVMVIGLGVYIYEQNNEADSLKDAYNKKVIMRGDYCLLDQARIMDIKVSSDKMDDATYYRAALAALDADIDPCDDAIGSKFFSTLVKSY